MSTMIGYAPVFITHVILEPVVGAFLVFLIAEQVIPRPSQAIDPVLCRLRIPQVLDVSAVPKDSQDQTGLIRLVVQNISDKGIRAYVIDVEFRDRDQKSFAHHAQATIMTFPDGHLRVLYPSETEKSPLSHLIAIQRRTGDSPVLALAVDLVVFNDGSRWGNISLRESAEVLSILAAMDRADHGVLPGRR